MFQRILFHWKSDLINRFLRKKYFYWVYCFKIGFYDDNVSVMKRSHVKNTILKESSRGLEHCRKKGEFK